MKYHGGLSRNIWSNFVRKTVGKQKVMELNPSQCGRLEE